MRMPIPAMYINVFQLNILNVVQNICTPILWVMRHYMFLDTALTKKATQCM
jgi:hypothetical protein